MHLTAKQIELLNVIAKGNGPNAPCDLDEILDRIRYETTKQSLQFSIRALVARDLIEKKGVEKRRGRQRQVIAATKAGLEALGLKAQPKPSIRVPDFVELQDDELLSDGLGAISDELLEGF